MCVWHRRLWCPEDRCSKRQSLLSQAADTALVLLLAIYRPHVSPGMQADQVCTCW